MPGRGCKTILWDFDGTLGRRELRWSGCMAAAVAEIDPSLAVAEEAVRPLLAQGYPWHEPEVTHCGIDADEWWERLLPVLSGAAEALGLPPERAAACAARVRETYVDPAGFRLFDDVLPVLGELRKEGWRNVVLSNHVPELPAIAAALGLDEVCDRVFTSASMGYEKPHPEAFRIALRWCEEPGESGWSATTRSRTSRGLRRPGSRGSSSGPRALAGCATRATCTG